MLQVNPTVRPTVEDIHAELIALVEDNKVDMKAPIMVCQNNYIYYYNYIIMFIMIVSDFF